MFRVSAADQSVLNYSQMKPASSKSREGPKGCGHRFISQVTDFMLLGPVCVRTPVKCL